MAFIQPSQTFEFAVNKFNLLNFPPIAPVTFGCLDMFIYKEKNTSEFFVLYYFL